MAQAPTQTLANLTAENKAFYERNLLERLLPDLVYSKYGQKKPMPKNEGDNINFRRFNSLAATTTPLVEGVTPDGNTLNISTVTAKVDQYGDYITISDKIRTAGIDPVVTEATDVLGEQAGLSIDTIVRDIVTAGTNVQYAGGVANRAAVAATNKLSAAEVLKARRTLKKNNVKPMDGKYYVGIIGPETEFDLLNDPLFVEVSKYSAATQIFDGEIGRIYGVRFVTTSNTKKFAGAGASSIDVHATMIIGKDAYGVVDISGSSKPQVIVKDLGSAGTADPLDQRGSVGWKALLTAVRLQELAMVRIEHAVTA